MVKWNQVTWLDSCQILAIVILSVSLHFPGCMDCHAQPFSWNHLHNQNSRGRFESRPCTAKTITVKPLVGAFKTVSTKQINIHRQKPRTPFWQRSFYEHVIRHEEALNRIRNYIATNPLRWQLDRENAQATGKDDFDDWLSKFHPKPATKAIVL